MFITGQKNSDVIDNFVRSGKTKSMAVASLAQACLIELRAIQKSCATSVQGQQIHMRWKL
jgi:hypothetical protein